MDHTEQLASNLEARPNHWHRRMGLTVVAATLITGAAMALTLAAAAGSGARHLFIPETVDAPISIDPQSFETPASNVPSRYAEGFTVNLFGRTNTGSNIAIGYSVISPDVASFTDMLGIPRIINPDGSIVLPVQYGEVDAESSLDSGRPGLQSGGESFAVYEPESIRAGSILRFGPFFQADSSGFELTARMTDLEAGMSVQIGGEPFLVSAETPEEGLQLLQLTFKPLQPEPTVVATHPASHVAVYADDALLKDMRGSTAFAKTEDLDVHANTSTVVVQGSYGPDSTVRIVVDSIGHVISGNWDFPMNQN